MKNTNGKGNVYTQSRYEALKTFIAKNKPHIQLAQT